MKIVDQLRKRFHRHKPIEVEKDKWLVRVQADMMERRAKFDISEDYYLRYRCTKCGIFVDADNEEVVFDECECGNTDIWITRGGAWIKKHGTKSFWDNITTTNDIMVPLVKRKWLVGQEKPMLRERMQLARWMYKLKQKQEALKRGDLEGAFMKENPGPYVLRISEPGTGKTMASKIINEEAETLYKEHDIELTDILTIENKADKQRPLVRQVPCHAVQGGGCLAPRISRQAERSALAEQKEKQQLILTFLMVAIGLGGALLVTGMFIMGIYVMAVGLAAAWFDYMSAYLFFFMTGVPLMVFPLFILVMLGSRIFGTSQAETANVPHPIVTHGDKPKYVQDATVSNSSTLLGSIEWNAYGNTPGLTGPLHRRVVSGIVHRQNDMIIDIDEIRNLQRHAAVEMLDVMENGQSLIRSRGSEGMGNAEASAILAISTADPVPADFMLIANGNMDLLDDPSSIFKTVKAFYDRFNYGDKIYYETHFDATPENEIKIAQVVTDEIYRFKLFPMERDGILRIIEHMRSRAENNRRFKIMFRYVINVILQAFEIALLRKDTITRAADVERAIDEFCDTLQSQALKEQLQNKAPFDIIRTSGKEYGMVNGLSVLSIQGVEGRSAGKAFPVVAQIFPVSDPKYGEFVVTGEMKDEASWVQDSKKTVRTVIRKLYGKDIAKDYYTHIAFARQKDVEGPSAGAAMVLALMSLLGDPRVAEKDRKPIPMRLDAAMTGTIELIPDPNNLLNVRVGTVGGVPDKIQGAADAGCKYVVVPMENFEFTLTKEKYPCQILGADSILGYFDLLRADGKGNLDTLLELRKPMTDEDVRLWAEKQAKRKGAM